jgi:predicted ribosomally synthesized peptide with nif11-like leader
MKTLEAFIQRLQDDEAFEKQAQTFVAADELMAFVRQEGYDFTLEQLMEKFQRQAKSPAEAGNREPPPPAVETSASGRAGNGVISCGHNPPGLPGKESQDIDRQQPGDNAPTSARVTPPPRPEDKMPLEFCKGGGGRHRGFSLRRVKYSEDEKP